ITFRREKFIIDGWRNSRVPGLIAFPKNGVARFPAIVLIDGIGVLGLSLGGMTTFFLGAVEQRLKVGVAGVTFVLYGAGRRAGVGAAWISAEAARVVRRWPPLAEAYAGAAVQWFRQHLQ
ncbi:MAG: hypothetical protein ACT4O1_15995, partial [Gemmatimonadota bacterium]